MSAALFLCIVYRRVAPHYVVLFLSVSAYTTHTFSQKSPGCGQIDTYKAFALDTVGRARLYPYAGVASERLSELSYRLPACFEYLATVSPRKICAFERHYTHPGNILGNVIAHALIIGMYVSEHGLQPRFAFVVCFLQGDNGKWTYIASLVVVDGSIDETMQTCVFDHDISHLQAGEIESLTWRDHSDAVAVAQRGHGRVMVRSKG